MLNEWDYSIDSGITVLPHGTYSFQVRYVEKFEYCGSKNLPPCHAFKVSMIARDSYGNTSYFIDNFYLVENLIWKFNDFFESVGIKSKNTIDIMNSIGLMGNCILKVSDDGKFNNVEKYINVSCKSDEQLDEWRNKVKLSDNNKCRLCGSDSNIEVHHIVPASADETQRYNVKNGITLCKKHHDAIHTWRKKHGEEPLEDNKKGQWF